MGNQSSQCKSALCCNEDQTPEYTTIKNTDNPLASTPMHTETKQETTRDEQCITNNANLEQCITKEALMNHIDGVIQEFFQIYNTIPENFGFEKLLDKNGFKIYSKNIDGGYLMRSEWYIPYTPQQFINFISDETKKSKWDFTISHIEKVCDVDQDTRIVYELHKGFLTVAPRDMLLVSKKGPIENGWMDICASVNAPGLIQENKKAVRAEVPIGGYYVENIERTKEGYIAKVISIGASRLGGSIPLALIKKMAATSIQKFGNEILKAMKESARL